MIRKIDFEIKELNLMKKYPKELFYIGNTQLLKKQKVSIVGSRRPSQYSQRFTHLLSQGLSQRDITVISGAAIGVDSIAHKSAKTENTIAVVANGLDIRYPAINEKLIKEIEKRGLMLSAYKQGEKARNYTFVLRNEIVVALGEILIVTHADEKSGTLSSINYALEMGKKVYTIPQRLDESKGILNYLKKGLITPIYNLEEFLNTFGDKKETTNELELYLKSFPSYEEAVKKYSNKILELELEGKIIIENGHIKPLS
ncbi:DNA processing protein DprA [Halarcobacter mediterraneus]|uniref:DNA processing protein DprA n=1 Tax=Halarcobacter mediterraneus TaxID=2023153 RepID=A0A4Q1AUA2_9BACT|nr:DNA-processing protein DprA [Halarcobacter mediterraneus]RXK13482.1 DNA processing protein DprA [Halarcobacter mediterraneus]